MDMGQEGTCDEINLALELGIGMGSNSSVDDAGANDSTSCDGVKKESDAGSEEVERVSCRGCSDEEIEVKGTKKKLRLSREQSALLEDRFREHSSISPKQRHALAEQLNLRPRQIEVWFQNRRARTRLKQMELDCQLLKKCCQKLTDENARLQKEVQQLRAVKVAPTPSIYMRCPVSVSAAVCRSCGRRCDHHDNGGNKNRSGEGA